MELACDRCGRSSFVPDDLVQGRAFRARCPDCGGVLDVAADRPGALDDQDLAWLAGQGRASAAPPVAAPPRPTEQAVARYERAAGAERRRRGVAAALGAGVLVAAAAAVLVFLSGRSGGRWTGRPPREAPVTPAAAAYDAAALAERAAAGAPAPEAGPAPAPTAPGRASAPPRRRKTAPISRSDRRLLDLLARKGDAAVVAPEGDALDSAAAGLDAETVARTVAGSRKAFDACVSRALRLDPRLRLQRRATLVLTVQPGGEVSGAFIAEEALDRSDLGACLCAAARRMVFPAFAGEPTDVSMPLSLSAGY